MEKYKLSDIFDFIRNGASIKQFDTKLGYPITRIETISNSFIDINRMGYADIIELGKYADYLLKDGDILMSHINSEKHLGKSAIYKEMNKDIIHGMNLLCLRPNKDICYPSYLNYFFNSNSFRSQIPRITKKSVNQASFSVSDLKNIKVSLPSLEKQESIANILDKAQELVDKRREQIDLLDELVKSRFIGMFGDPVRNEKGWEEISLGELFISDVDYRGKTPPKSSSGIPLISAANVKMGKIDLSNADYISEEDYGNWLKRGIPDYNDILITTEAPMGRVALYPEGLYQLSRRVIAFKPDKARLNSYFALYTISSDSWQKRLYRKVRGSTVPRILKPDLLAEEIQIPPIELQNEFEQLVKQIYKIKEHMQQNLTELENNFNSLMQRAFKGEL